MDIHTLFGPRKLPVMLQTEAAECGLASVAMVAAFHGYQSDLLTLRQRFSTSLKGMTLADMVRIADSLGLSSRALRLELDEMGQLKLPCILHWNLNHFVVLAKVEKGGIVIHDPATGRRHVKWEEVSRSFTGIALELNPTAQFRKAEVKQQVPLRSLLSGLSGLRHTVLQVFLLALVLELLAIVSPLFTQWMVDGVLLSADRDMLKVLVAGSLLVVISQVAVSALRSWAVLNLSTAMGLQWMNRVFSHLLRLPVAYFEKRFIGDVASRFQGVATIQQTLTSYFIEAILDGLLAVGTLVLMLIYSPVLTLIAIAGLGVYGLLRWAWYGYLKEITEKQLVIGARQESHFLETLRGIQAITLFQRQGERRSAWLNLLVEQTNTAVQAEKVGIAYRISNTLLVGLEQAAVLWFGASLVLDNVFSVGMYMAFASYSAQFSSRMVSLIDKAVSLKMLRLQTERLADIVLTEPEPLPSLVVALPTEPSIEFRNVSFRYAENEAWVCRHLNFRVEPGESVALVGPSGCGKTTILKLILGIFTPEEGDILIGGVPAKQLGPHGIRELCACVMQDDHLFAGSLADNIAFFDPKPDRQRIEACARLAAIHDAISAMPMGYQTLAGDMGTTLSGGQKQRVLLARALYKAPSILLLDEATSHLDTGLERQVNDAVSTLSLTRLIVAHRPETIASADRVVRIGNASGPGEDEPVARAAHAVQ
ncbi:peptidase domain-containing ABC transporter [Pseudogulbenkiania sp. MAI-1]|uniref:peptidase domain-containing ABC transporter n=1 Tax=Pseudogulbenkiania sp. MAI-1 TaxID=990370 RepID=UPI0004B02F3B|nr:peptidase domain-containing ABC transporter [Pseudogulbenkiania sp. MAI-1]